MIDIRIRLYEGTDDDIIEAINRISGDGGTHSDSLKRLIRELIVTRHVMTLMSSHAVPIPAIEPSQACSSDDPFDIDFSDIEI